MVKRIDLGMGFFWGLAAMVVLGSLIYLFVTPHIGIYFLGYPIVYMLVWGFLVGMCGNESRRGLAALASWSGCQFSTGSPLLSTIVATLAFIGEDKYRKEIGQ